MKPTLQDIADATGFAISTVSRALKGSQKISHKTRIKIHNAADQLNYPLHTDTEGDKIMEELKIHFVIVGFHRGEFYSSFFHGVNQAVEKSKIQLSLISIQKSFDELLVSIKDLAKQNFHGMILYIPVLRGPQYQEIKKVLPKDYPVISNHLIENPVFSTVAFDTYGGGFMTGKHFMKKGYTKCGIIDGPMKKAGTRNRANGFKDYIRQHTPMELVWQYNGDLSFQAGTEAFNEFDALDTKPEAIFACNDVMAHAFLQEALLKNYAVPDEIAIVGYDDLPICTRHKPTISSVHTNYEKLGTVTINKMKEMISNPGQVRGVVSFVPVSLVERESS